MSGAASLASAVLDAEFPTRIVAVTGGLHAGKTSLVDLMASSGQAENIASPHESLLFSMPAGYVAPGELIPLRLGRWGAHSNAEARRGITVRNACCSVATAGTSPIASLQQSPLSPPHLTRGTRCVVHMFDTPGHCGFFHSTAAAIAAADIVCVVVSLVEGATPTTEAAIAAAVAAASHIVLVLSDCDRLCLDLRLPVQVAASKIVAVIEQFNSLLRAAGGQRCTEPSPSPGYARSVEVSHAAGTIVFALSPLGVTFSVRSLLASWYGAAAPRCVSVSVPATSHVPLAWRGGASVPSAATTATTTPTTTTATTGRGPSLLSDNDAVWWSLLRRMTSEAWRVTEGGEWFDVTAPLPPQQQQQGGGGGAAGAGSASATAGGGGGASAAAATTAATTTGAPAAASAATASASAAGVSARLGVSGFAHCVLQPLWKLLAAIVGAEGDSLEACLTSLNVPSTTCERKMNTKDMLRMFVPRLYRYAAAAPLVDALLLGPDARIGGWMRWHALATAGGGLIARAVRCAARHGGGLPSLRLVDAASVDAVERSFEGAVAQAGVGGGGVVTSGSRKNDPDVTPAAVSTTTTTTTTTTAAATATATAAATTTPTLAPRSVRATRRRQRWSHLPTGTDAAAAAGAGQPLVAIVVFFEAEFDDDGAAAGIGEAARGQCARREPYAVVRVLSGVLHSGATVVVRDGDGDGVAATVGAVQLASSHAVVAVGPPTHRSLSRHSFVDVNGVRAAAKELATRAVGDDDDDDDGSTGAGGTGRGRGGGGGGGGAGTAAGRSGGGGPLNDVDMSPPDMDIRRPPPRAVPAPRLASNGLQLVYAALSRIAPSGLGSGTDIDRDITDELVETTHRELALLHAITPWTKADVALALSMRATFLARTCAGGGGGGGSGSTLSSSHSSKHNNTTPIDAALLRFDGPCFIPAGHVGLVNGLALRSNAPYCLVLDASLAHRTQSGTAVGEAKPLRFAPPVRFASWRAPGGVGVGVEGGGGGSGRSDLDLEECTSSDGSDMDTYTGNTSAGPRDVPMHTTNGSRSNRFPSESLAVTTFSARILRAATDDPLPPRLAPLPSRITERVFGVEVEPSRPSDLPTLLAALGRLQLIDPGVEILAAPSGTHRVNGTCEMQLDVALATLRSEFSPLSLRLTEPMVNFKESVVGDTPAPAIRGPDPSDDVFIRTVAGVKSVNGMAPDLQKSLLEGRSPDTATAVGLALCPLEPPSVIEAFERSTSRDRMTSRGVFDWTHYKSSFGWDEGVTNSLWTCGPPSAIANVLMCDVVKVPSGTTFSVADGAVYEPVLHGAQASLCDAFEYAVEGGGVLMGAPLRGIAARLQSLLCPAFDPAVASRSGPFAFLPTPPSSWEIAKATSAAMKRSLHAAQITANPVVLEPLLQYAFTGPSDGLRAVENVCSKRRCRIAASFPVPATPLSSLVVVVPGLESNGFEAACRVASHGTAYAHITFAGWDIVPGDPLDSSIPPPPPFETSSVSGLARDVVQKIRKRKGMGPLLLPTDPDTPP